MVQLSPALPNGFKLFPDNNIWNTPVDQAPIHPLNAQWMDATNGHTAHPFHPNFGYLYGGVPNGFPYALANRATPLVHVAYRTDVSYASESDPIPVAGLPIPVDAYVDSGEGHLHVIDTDAKVLHEFYGAQRQADGSWLVTQYSRWDLTSNALRPDGWTSTNAAGTPMVPGLVRYDEIQNGVISHALGFTISLVYAPHLWPARHDANSGGPLNPPLGMRVRLKSGFDISGFSPTNQIILNALKKYGMINHDTGGDWFLSGAPNANFNDSDLHQLTTIIPQLDFEVVDTSLWMVYINSGEVLRR